MQEVTAEKKKFSNSYLGFISLYKHASRLGKIIFVFLNTAEALAFSLRYLKTCFLNNASSRTHNTQITLMCSFSIYVTATPHFPQYFYMLLRCPKKCIHFS